MTEVLIRRTSIVAMAVDEQLIYRTISAALLAARLKPGTPLREAALSEVFGVSRERVRKVLQRLGHQRLIEVIPNRGAFVATPSLEQARQIYEARRILEGGIVAWLAQRFDSEASQSLQLHLKRERAAAKRGNRAESVRLSSQFHLLLGDATGSEFIQRELHELVSRTSMLVALFEPSSASHCACDEHAQIVDALTAGDAAAALKAMQVHLSLIETRLRPGSEAPDTDAAEVLRKDWQAVLAAHGEPS